MRCVSIDYTALESKSITSSRKLFLEDVICMGDTARKTGKNGVECFRPDNSPKNNLLSDLNIL